MLSDEAYLQQTVEMLRQVSRTFPQQIISVKNTQSHLIFCSQYLLDVVGANESDVLGKVLYFPFYRDDERLQHAVQTEDMLIIQTQKPILTFKINHFRQGLTPYFCTKSPIINPDTQKVVGVACQGFPIAARTLQQCIQKTLDSYHSPQSDTHPKLSRREKQIIFFFLSNLSSQQIAAALQQMEGTPVSKSTIDSVFIDQLYPKFAVYNRPDLAKKLAHLGFEQRVPTEVLKCTSIILETIEAY